tara:strand:+ start:23434 stop:23562 length:129 start_codon:yes stop_codon:yes gene_type:complete
VGIKGTGRTALKILKFEVTGDGKIGTPNTTFSDKLGKKCEQA